MAILAGGLDSSLNRTKLSRYKSCNRNYSGHNCSSDLFSVQSANEIDFAPGKNHTPGCQVLPDPRGAGLPEEGDEGVAIERTASSAACEAGDLVWTKIVAGGPAPEPRSDHSTSLIGTSMLHMYFTNAVLALAQAWHDSD